MIKNDLARLAEEHVNKVLVGKLPTKAFIEEAYQAGAVKMLELVWAEVLKLEEKDPKLLGGAVEVMRPFQHILPASDNQ